MSAPRKVWYIWGNIKLSRIISIIFITIAFWLFFVLNFYRVCLIQCLGFGMEYLNIQTSKHYFKVDWVTTLFRGPRYVLIVQIVCRYKFVYKSFLSCRTGYFSNSMPCFWFVHYVCSSMQILVEVHIYQIRNTIEHNIMHTVFMVIDFHFIYLLIVPW